MQAGELRKYLQGFTSDSVPLEKFRSIELRVFFILVERKCKYVSDKAQLNEEIARHSHLGSEAQDAVDIVQQFEEPLNLY